MKLERLKNLREDADMSQESLSKILGISQRTLSHYESGERNIPIEILIKTADHFNCSVDYILGRTDSKMINKP